MTLHDHTLAKTQNSLLDLFPKGTLTLGSVLECISTETALTDTRRRDLASSIRLAAAAIGVPVEQVPADPNWLRQRLARVVPAGIGLSKKTWSNVLSNAKAALMLAGVVPKGAKRRQFLGPWQELWDRLHDMNLKISLTRFMTFCSNQSIHPDAVSAETVEDFVALSKLASLRKDPKLAHYYLTTSWNKAVLRIPGWPTLLLDVPQRRTVFKISEAGLPASFRRDLARYLSVMAATDPLADGGPPKPLAPASLGQYRRQILRFAGELVRSGMAVERLTDIGVLVRPENAEKGLRQMIDRRNGTTSKTIYGMAYMLKTIAKHHVRCPASDLARLDTMCRRLRVRDTGMTPKNRARLRQFDDQRHVARLLHMSAELVAAAKRGILSPKRSAMLVEVAVAIDFLFLTALRIKNLAGLHLDRNIERSRAARVGFCHVVVEAHEVKNGQHLEFELDKDATALLQMFIERHRPLLVPAYSRWLFGRRDGSGPMSTTVLSQRISRTIRDRTGLEVNPHLFRSLGAKLYLDRHPGGYEVVRRMLGHASLSTTLQAYTGLESTSAAKHFDQTIRALRDASPTLIGKRRVTPTHSGRP